jgi:hypothetical protein
MSLHVAEIGLRSEKEGCGAQCHKHSKL